MPPSGDVYDIAVLKLDLLQLPAGVNHAHFIEEVRAKTDVQAYGPLKKTELLANNNASKLKRRA